MYNLLLMNEQTEDRLLSIENRLLHMWRYL